MVSIRKSFKMFTVWNWPHNSLAALNLACKSLFYESHDDVLWCRSRDFSRGFRDRSLDLARKNEQRHCARHWSRSHSARVHACVGCWSGREWSSKIHIKQFNQCQPRAGQEKSENRLQVLCVCVRGNDIGYHQTIATRYRTNNTSGALTISW